MSAETIHFPKFAVTERFYQPGHIRQQHDYVAVAGTTAEDVLKPAYWSRLGSRLRTYDTVTVIEESGAWFAELLVLSASQTGVQLAPLRGINLSGHHVGANDESVRNYTGATVKYRGPHLRWSVLDKDGAVLQEKHASESSAYGWLNSWVKGQQA